MRYVMFRFVLEMVNVMYFGKHCNSFHFQERYFLPCMSFHLSFCPISGVTSNLYRIYIVIY